MLPPVESSILAIFGESAAANRGRSIKAAPRRFRQAEVSFESRTVHKFLQHLKALQKGIRTHASEQFARFMVNPRHPSLPLKPLADYRGGFFVTHWP
jgi:hypothetical protein